MIKMIIRLIIVGFPFFIYPMNQEETYFDTMQITSRRQYLDAYSDNHNNRHKHHVKERYENAKRKREIRQNSVRPMGKKTGGI